MQLGVLSQGNEVDNTELQIQFARMSKLISKELATEIKEQSVRAFMVAFLTGTLFFFSVVYFFSFFAKEIEQGTSQGSLTNDQKPDQ